MRAYSQDLRDRVIESYKTGKYSKRWLSKFFKLAYQTVFDWVKKYEQTGEYQSRQHCQTGRQARFADREKVLEFLSRNPDAQGIDMRHSLAPELPMSTFYDTLKRMKVTYKKRAKI